MLGGVRTYETPTRITRTHVVRHRAIPSRSLVGAGRTTTARTGVRPIRLEGLAWLRFEYGRLRHRRLATVAGSQEESMTTTPPNHAQQTAAGRRGCHPRVSWPPSLIR